MSNTSAKQEPAQEQPAAAPIHNKQNLDMLQSMMNMVLIQSGRFIKEHQSGGGTGRNRMALRNMIPIATERFQDALDELENEVRLAQTVLRRDLALLKQDRKKREMAAKEKEAEKARQAAETRTLGSGTKAEEVSVAKVSTPAEPEAPAALERSKSNEPEADVKIPPPIETSTPGQTERDPLFDGTPTTANPQETEFDFDAMFGDDAMDTNNDNNDTHGDMMDTSGDMGFDFGDGDGDNDGPSLLRGLEDFAKGGDEESARNHTNMGIDITMGDLNNTTVEPQKPTEGPATQAPAPAEPPKQEASAADAMMADMSTTDNLDDLFDMDDYANPENSSFDDAFFNFE